MSDGTLSMYSYILHNMAAYNVFCWSLAIPFVGIFMAIISVQAAELTGKNYMVAVLT